MSLYLALDGPDGCGKSLQTRLLVEWLQEQGQPVLHVREPGSTPVGEALRGLLLAKSTGDLDALSEAMLFLAARRELLKQVIVPALAAGQHVVAERCYLSTLVYQFLALGNQRLVPWFFETVRAVHGEHLPRAIFLLDVPECVARKRRARRTEDRIEARGAAFEAAVREGYRNAAQLEARALCVDAAWPIKAVQATLRWQVQRLLAEANHG